MAKENKKVLKTIVKKTKATTVKLSAQGRATNKGKFAAELSPKVKPPKK